MKKFITLLSVLFAALALFPLVACGEKNEEGKLEIVCTIFPQYDWVINLTKGNDDVNVTLLQDSGVDLHNYQPTAADKVKILNCDLLIYIGGESDSWVEDILKGAKNEDRKELKLLEKIDSLEEEHVPGAEEEEEEEEEGAKDEHIWLSLKRADALCKEIAKALQEIDPENDVLYENNMHEYTSQISALEEEYKTMIEGAERKVMVVCDRFPFRYLAEDYNLEYYAAFSGCSAETEASFSTVIALAKAVDENALPYVLVLEGSDQKIAKQVIEQTKTKSAQILPVNSIQSVTRKDIDAGVSYLSLMRENLTSLKTALGGKES